MTEIACEAPLSFCARMPVCGRPAVDRVTIAGAKSFDVTAQPNCASCARINKAIVAKYYPQATFAAVPIAG